MTGFGQPYIGGFRHMLVETMAPPAFKPAFRLCGPIGTTPAKLMTTRSGIGPPPRIRIKTMTNQTAPIARDNLLGVCHTIGDTFGFNPLYLRLLLLVGVMLNAEIAVAAYAVAGIAVLVARLATRSSGKRASARALIHA
jgi:phage shock protein C